jgi:hypothetical protein
LENPLHQFHGPDKENHKFMQINLPELLPEHLSGIFPLNLA